MSKEQKDVWVNLQEEVIQFVSERNGSAFPRPSDSAVAILAGTFDNSYEGEGGELLSSKVALKELLASSDVDTDLEMNINGHEWHYILTFHKGDYITPSTTTEPTAKAMEELKEQGEVDITEIAGSPDAEVEEIVIEEDGPTEEPEKEEPKKVEKK